MKEMFSFFSSVFGSKGSQERITAGELLAMIEGKEKITLIDVRTTAEFKGGHIPVAFLCRSILSPRPWWTLPEGWSYAALRA